MILPESSQEVGVGAAGASMTHAPAKINLLLRVLGHRPDGFHELCSLVMGVGLCDTLRFARAEAGEIKLTCSDPALPSDDRNLVIRAARMLTGRSPSGSGADIHLDKRIPIAAGLGGGSSDAAAALHSLNRLWNAGLEDTELAAPGANLGSDVPLFFSLPTAVIRGRGEQVQAVRMRWSGWVLLVFGGWPVLTADVYEAWEPGDAVAPDETEIDRMLEASNASSVMAMTANDLEPAVFRVCSAVRQLLERVNEKLNVPVRVSGAGSTLFTLFDDEQSARGALALLEKSGLNAVVVRGGSNAMNDQ